MARGVGASLERLLDKERSNVTGTEGAIVVEKRMPLFSGWKAPSVGRTTFSKRVLIPDSRIWRLRFHTASVESSLMRGVGFGRLLPFREAQLRGDFSRSQNAEMGDQRHHRVYLFSLLKRFILFIKMAQLQERLPP